MTNIADKLVAYAQSKNSPVAQKFFSDNRKVYDTKTLDNHVYVSLPKRLSDRFTIQDELTKIGLVFEAYFDYRKKQWYVCIDYTNL